MYIWTLTLQSDILHNAIESLMKPDLKDILFSCCFLSAVHNHTFINMAMRHAFFCLFTFHSVQKIYIPYNTWILTIEGVDFDLIRCHLTFRFISERVYRRNISERIRNNCLAQR